MIRRTASTITVGFTKFAEDVGNKLSYSVEITGSGSENAQKSCDERVSECTASNLLPGRPYGFSITPCFKGSTPVLCSVASDVTSITALPKGKKTIQITIRALMICG